MADNGFWAQAQAHPARVAIVDDGGAQPTFGELFARQNRTANALRAHGLTVGDCVASLRAKLLLMGSLGGRLYHFASGLPQLLIVSHRRF
jgi:non-ribosomal peptide synthetase component F